MKITISTEQFLNILLPLQSIVNDNHIIPILQSVKLDFESGEVTATGNNLEVCCSTKLEQLLTVKSPISTCVNYLMLLAIVKSISDKELTLNIKKNDIEIIHSKGRFNLPIEASNEFPMPESSGKLSKTASVSGTTFRSALKVANKFILIDDLDAMASISISIGKKIFVRSTDRNRLFEEKIKGTGDKEEILISGKASLAISSLLEEIEENVEMKYNNKAIYFKFDNKVIVVTQQQGDFPLKAFSNVLSFIKEAEPLKINVKSFVTALKRVSIMSAREKYSTVRLDIDKKQIIISCESELTATKGEESIDSKFFEKKLIGYNYKYLIEILSVFEKEPDLLINSAGILFIQQKKKVGALSPILLKS